MIDEINHWTPQNSLNIFTNNLDGDPIAEEKDYQSYATIQNLVNFLSEHLQEIRNNPNQLKALDKSLKSTYKYMQDINELKKSNEIPRTWTDLNENTMFI